MDNKKTSTPLNDALVIQAGKYDSLYEQIVKPDRALYLSAYFARWVKHLGPDLAWMYASFRQAAYMDGARNGDTTSRITVAEIAARAGISRRTYQTRAADPKTWEKLCGLVSRVEENPVWDISSGTPRQLPFRFVVAMTLPLTPVDTASLRHWLLNHLEQHGGAEGVLRAAAEAPLNELIPVRAEIAEGPVTVRALVHKLFGDQLEAKLLDALASAIQNHIMPSNKQIKITVFFLEHVLIHLGAGPGWAVTLLRDKCFDSESETRNRVVIRGGYAEIAAWLGLNRVKTMWEWLNMKKDAKYINPILNLYLREIADERDYDKRERTFKVLLEEIPFEMLEAFATGQGLVAELLAKGADFERVMSQEDFVARRFSLGLADFAPTDGAIFTPDLKEFATQLGGTCTHTLADFAPPFGATCTHALADPAPHLGANCAVKALKPLSPNSITPPTQPAVGDGEKTPQSELAATAPENKPVESEKPAQAGGRAGWIFSEIAQNNSINNKGAQVLRKYFADEKILSQKFLAWILYAYSPLGKGLTDTTGVSKAIKSLCNTQPEFAARKFEMLAKLGPQRLQELFDRDYAREDPGKSIEANIYAANFKKLDPARKSDLYFALFGQDNPEPAARPKKVEQPKTAYQIRLEEIKARKAALQQEGAA